MRILHISDIHCSTTPLKLLPGLVARHEAEVLVVSGDLECNDYVLGQVMQVGIPVVGVPGNMDDAYVSRTMSEKGVNIDARITRIKDLFFAGIGGRTPLSSLNRISMLLEENDPRRTIIVSHHPPHGTRIDLALSGIHAGLHELRELLEKHQPLACLCGHIHESPGIDRVGETLVINPGPFYTGRYAVIDTEGPRAELLVEKMP